VLAGLVVAVSVVEDELVVLDVLCYAIYFNFWLVNPDFGVATRDRVDFSNDSFLLKQWSFTHADTDVHLRASNVVKCLVY